MTNTTYTTNPTILSIDTSCDETSASVTSGLTVLSNIVWSQSNIHAKFGGVVPNLTVRQHERKIFWVVKKAVDSAKVTYQKIDAVSVTVGPGLAIALAVGINFAKEFAKKYNKPLIAVNHLEGHLLSALAERKNQISNIKCQNEIFKCKNNHTDYKCGDFYSSNLLATSYQLPTFPSFGIVVSGGNTLLVLIEKIGKYKILAQTIDDALGESLDKSARLLGLGYPGGAVLEKFARKGDAKKHPLPIPMLGRENEGFYSYSGLKTAFSRLYLSLSENGYVTKSVVYDLAASYQSTAFEHFIRVTSKTISATNPIPHTPYPIPLFVGGGVSANIDLRKRIRVMCKKLDLTSLFPYSKKLCGDNAAMIGIAAYFKYLKREFVFPSKIDRLPNLKVDKKI